MSRMSNFWKYLSANNTRGHAKLNIIFTVNIKHLHHIWKGANIMVMIPVQLCFDITTKH